jgi:hypothetical protein
MGFIINKWWATEWAFDPIEVEFGPLVFPGEEAPAGYEPPAYNAVDGNLVSPYTPPAWSNASADIKPEVGTNQTLWAVGKIDQSVVPEPHQVAWRKYLTPGSIYEGGYGTPKLIDARVIDGDLTTAYTPPAWDAVSANLGGAAGEIFIDGFDAGSWGSPLVEFRNRAIYPASFNNYYSGQAALVYRQFLSPFALDAGSWGTLSIINRNRYILPTGPAAGSFGTASVTNKLQITYPSGLAAGSFGTASLINKNRYVIPTALDAFKGFGADTWISFLDRTLSPGGIFAVQFGTAQLAGGIRELDLAGRGIAATSWGTTLVAYKQRFVYPNWFAAGAFGYPVVDQTHFVTTAGWDSSLWGTAYIHDNKQYVYPTAFQATAIGTPEVTRSPRIVAPTGFVSLRDTLPNERWGTQTVWNLRQIVTQLNETTPGDGGVFGSPIWMSIANRNRNLGTNGHRDSAFGLGTIRNGAWALVPAGLDATQWGSALVAYRIRHVYPEPFDAGWITNYHVVLKTPELFPVGFNRSALGTPGVQNTRRYYNNVGGFETSSFGTAFVAPRVRSIEPYYSYEGRVGDPQVFHNPRAIVPEGFTGGFGMAYVEEHFTIIFPSSVIRGRGIGEPFIYNSTPNLYPYGYEQTLFGHTAVRNAWERYNLEGFWAGSFGKPVIEYRTKTVRPSGLNATRTGEHAEVRNVDPDPPHEQAIQPTGFDAANLQGSHSIRGNSIYPSGFDAVKWGQHTVRLQGAIVSSFGGEAFGLAKVSGPQYVTVTAIKPPDEADPTQKAGRVDPYTIWCWTDPPPQAAANNGGSAYEIMDTVLHPDDPERPVFGEPSVTHKNRYLLAGSPAIDSLFGEPAVTLKRRTIYPVGLKAQRFGIPGLNATQWVICEYPADTLAFGYASIAYREGPDIPRYLYPSGLSGEFGVAWIDFYNRALGVTGIAGTSWGLARVHPPEPIIPVGLNATLWGDAFISLRIRNVYPDGFDATSWGFTPGDFTNRMRVWKNNLLRVAPAGIEAGQFGVQTIDQSIRRISGAGAIGQWIIPHGADVRRFNVIAMAGYGWDSSIFGDVQRWEAGKIKPQGETYDLWGKPRIDRRMTVPGWESMLFGAPRMAPAVDPYAIDAGAWGMSTITHGDNLDFVCGQSGRAIPPAGWDDTHFGTASVQ